MLSSRNISQPGQMKVEPDTPVKPDKIRLRKVTHAVTKVTVAQGKDAIDYFFTWTGRVPRTNGIEFTDVQTYIKTNVGYSKYWVEGNHRNSIIFYFPHIVVEVDSEIEVCDKDDLQDLRDQERRSTYDRFRY